MTKQEHLLVVAMEECAEIQQAISKALRFGMDNYSPSDPNKTTNEEGILTEYYQLLGVFAMLINDGVLHDIDIPTKCKIIDDKMEKVEKYMQISKDCGRVIGNL